MTNTMNTTHHTAACRADACQQGRLPCPCPHLCELEDPLSAALGIASGLVMSIAAWVVIALALAAALWP